MRNEFIQAVNTHQSAYGLRLTEPQIRTLGDYYDLVQEHNPLLHLVGPSTPVEFAVRHILESLTLLEYLPQKIRFADVGAGAGLPSIPCLIVRDDLKATLIDAKEKKAAFLGEAVSKLGLSERVEIVNRQFEEITPANCEIITCRALDKFAAKLPKLIAWAKKRKMILYGGPGIRDGLSNSRVSFEEHLLPMSEQRYLFDVSPSN